MMLELAQNQTVQNKIRKEIQSVLESNNNELTYEVMKKMTYTDMAIAGQCYLIAAHATFKSDINLPIFVGLEILRKYPPLGMVIRQTNKNYKIPDTEIVIPADTSVVISVYGIHTDAKYYENPEEFRPERFTEQEKAKRPNYTYLPFGDGPRGCIGRRLFYFTNHYIHNIKEYIIIIFSFLILANLFIAKRFAKMQIKVGLVYMLKDSSYRVSPKMKFPLEFEKNFGLLTSLHGIWLQREKL